jgi:MFS family permease
MEIANIGSPLLTASIQYIINVAFTLPAIIYIDKWGRRPTLLVGSFLMMVLFFINGALQAVYGQPQTIPKSDITWIIEDNKPVSCAIVACSYLFVAAYATTWGPVSWCYPAEIFPSKVRAKAVSLTVMSNWFWNSVLSFAVPPMLYHISWKVYMIFGSFNGLALIHVFLAAPETKGKTLEEMDEVFESGRKAWQPQPRGSRLDDLAKRIEEATFEASGRVYMGSRRGWTRSATARASESSALPFAAGGGALSGSAISA